MRNRRSVAYFFSVPEDFKPGDCDECVIKSAGLYTCQYLPCRLKFMSPKKIPDGDQLNFFDELSQPWSQ